MRKNLYYKISVVMVTGGKLGWTSVELLSTDGTRLCSLPNLPTKRYRHSQTGLVTCGGGDSRSSDQKSCVTFAAGRWKKTHTLGRRWHGHTGWASPRGVMLMGGHGGNRLTTTELLTDNGGATPSFNLNYERQ